MRSNLATDAVADQDLRHRIDQRDHLCRQQPEQHAARRQPDETDTLGCAGVVRTSQPGLTRLAQEDHTEELHHHVAAERGHECHARRRYRDKVVHKGARQAEREQETL